MSIVPRQYDVALSFAGRHRPTAKRLHTLLTEKGLSVFYDGAERSRLLGRDESLLESVYSKESRLVVPIISREYRDSEWPRFELDVAKEEQKRRKSRYIIPLREDDTRILGLPDGMFYFDARKDPLEDFVDVIVQMVNEEKLEERCRSSRKSQSMTREEKSQTPVYIPSPRDVQLLGLLATADFPLTTFSLSELIPCPNWPQKIRHFKRLGLLDSISDMLRVKRAVVRRLFPDKQELQKYRNKWIQSLEGLQQRPDLALMLAFQYLLSGMGNEAIAVVAKGAYTFSSRAWTAIFLKAMNRFERAVLPADLSPDTRAAILHARACNLITEGKYAEALVLATRLLDASEKGRSRWGVGQAYMDIGVSQLHLGNTDLAEQSFERAQRNARSAKDRLLLGRALNNLGFAVLEQSPERAMKLFRKSLASKKSARDEEGLVGAMLGLGNVHATKGDYAKAKVWFLRAARQARKGDLSDGLVVALVNVGRTHCDLNHPDRSGPCFEEAVTICRREKLEHSLLQALVGKAYSLGLLEKYSKAAAVAQEAAELAKQLQNVDAALGALHDRAVYLMRSREYRAGEDVLKVALRLAKSKGLLDWVTKCHCTQAHCYVEAGHTGQGIDYLRRATLREERAGFLGVSLRLWQECASLITFAGTPLSRIECVLEHLVKSLSDAKEYWPQLAEALCELYTLKRRKKDLKGAVRVLTGLASLANAAGDSEYTIRALDEKGLCFQDLGNLRGAEPFHREALRLARQADLKAMAVTSLNNLGELLRQTSRPKAAIRAFTEAESLARTLRDIEGEISIAQNRALALRDAGDARSSERLINACRRRAKSRGLVHEYVRALEGLANIAWVNNHRKRARRLYLQVLHLSRKHKLVKLECDASLNLSALLQNEWRFSEALRLLRRVETRVSEVDHEHLFFKELAELAESRHDCSAAKKYWQRAIEAARTHGDRETARQCSIALRGLDAADSLVRYDADQLDAMVKREENPKARARLLLSLFELLLSCGRQKRAERVFRELQSLAPNADEAEVMTEAHVILGDYTWHQGASGRFMAAKAFAAAMVRALELGGQRYAEVSGHFGGLLLSLDSPTPTKVLTSLERDLAGWLRRQITVKGSEPLRRLPVLPIRLARTMSSWRLKGRNPSAAEVRQLLRKEFARAGI